MKLYNADCLEILKTLPDKSIDLIVTDPPYDISATNEGGSVNNVKKLNKSLNDLVVSDLTEGYDIVKFNSEFVRVINLRRKTHTLACGMKATFLLLDNYID